MGKPIIPVRTRIYSLIQDDVMDAAELLSIIGIDEQWVRDIIEDEMAWERRRRSMGGVYCPAAVGWINSMDSSFGPSRRRS